MNDRFSTINTERINYEDNKSDAVEDNDDNEIKL